MNHVITSRALLLDAAKALAHDKGLSGVNIRAVAAKCGVSVGSIYNYFPTKADLIAAIVEDFWRQAVHHSNCTLIPGESFPAYVGRLFSNLRQGMLKFQTDWLAQLAALGADAKTRGRELEGKCFAHMKHGLLAALGDCPVPGGDREAFIDFVFSNLLCLLREDNMNCAYFQNILERLTTKESE